MSCHVLPFYLFVFPASSAVTQALFVDPWQWKSFVWAILWTSWIYWYYFYSIYHPLLFAFLNLIITIYYCHLLLLCKYSEVSFLFLLYNQQASMSPNLCLLYACTCIAKYCWRKQNTYTHTHTQPCWCHYKCITVNFETRLTFSVSSWKPYSFITY